MTNITNSAIASSTLINNAFKAADASVKQGNNSVQAMAAGIMLYHAETHTSDRAMFDKMAEKGEAFTSLKKELAAEFVVSRVTDKTVNTAGQLLTIDQVTKQNRTNATQMVALNKGFDLAIALHSVGVTSTSFDAKTGLFSVPVSVLLPSGADAVGQLSKREKANETISLDGTAYRYDLDNKLISFNAFPAHLLAVAGYKKAKPASKVAATGETVTASGASNTTTNGGASATALHGAVKSWSLDKMAKMLGDCAYEIAEILDVTGSTMALCDWPDDVVNCVSELEIMQDSLSRIIELRNTAKAKMAAEAAKQAAA